MSECTHCGGSGAETYLLCRKCFHDLLEANRLREENARLKDNARHYEKVAQNSVNENARQDERIFKLCEIRDNLERQLAELKVAQSGFVMTNKWYNEEVDYLKKQLTEAREFKIGGDVARLIYLDFTQYQNEMDASGSIEFTFSTIAGILNKHIKNLICGPDFSRTENAAGCEKCGAHRTTMYHDDDGNLCCPCESPIVHDMEDAADDEDKILPCPAWGKNKTSILEASDGSFYVFCHLCAMCGPQKDSEQAAIRVWNELPRRNDLGKYLNEQVDADRKLAQAVRVHLEKKLIQLGRRVPCDCGDPKNPHTQILWGSPTEQELIEAAGESQR